MKNYREKSLQEWIQNTAPKITPKSFDTVHLDEIGYKQEDYWSRPFLEQIFIETVVLIGNLDSWFKLSLVLPLEDLLTFKKVPDPRTLTIDGLLREKRECEPPSVYLTGHELALIDWPMELYKCPLTWPIDSLDPESYMVHLHISRGLEDIQNNLEYGRWIGAEYAPPWKG